MNKRQRKQIAKRIEGYKKQILKHEEKIKTIAGRKDTTHDYWKKEIEQMKKEKNELEEKTEK